MSGRADNSNHSENEITHLGRFVQICGSYMYLFVTTLNCQEDGEGFTSISTYGQILCLALLIGGHAITGIVLYPMILRLAFEFLGQYTHRGLPYKDGDCLLKLINETNPAHFESHPLWPHLGYNSSSCADAMKYGKQQALHNDMEGSILLTMGAIQVIGSFAYLVWSAFNNPHGGNNKWYTKAIGFLQIICFGWLAAMNFQYTLHYQHDMYHLAGNLVHHAAEDTMQENGTGEAQFGNSIPHGLLPTLAIYEAVIPCLIYIAYNTVSFPTIRPYSEFIAAALLMSPLIMAVRPYLHQGNKSLSPYPLSAIFDDYNRHLVQHHRDGTCLGVVDMLPLSHLYSLLMKAHGYLYKHDLISRATRNHEMFNISMDYMLLGVTFVTFTLFFGMLKILSSCFSSQKEKEKVKSN